MRTVKVKICGITREEDLKIVSAMGADAVGFVVGVPSSQRNISQENAEKLLKHVPIFVKSVLVTVPRSTTEVLNLCETLNPDAVQIHGDFSPNVKILRERLQKTSLIRAINTNPFDALDIASNSSKRYDAIHLDSFIQGKYGGTGTVQDWNLSLRFKQVLYSKPMILAGGLNPKNVHEAIQKVQPYAVDVSTGVERRPGIKDPRKVQAFIENAKNCKLPYK